MSGKPGAGSARRAVELLFAFEDEPVASVRALAERVDMPVPSTHRYIALLRDMGVVEEARTGQYRLTMRVASLGQAARRGTSLLETVQPFMQQLNEETGESVLLIQPIGGLPVCTHRVESDSRIRLSFEIGQALPALRGASAHLLVAALPEEERFDYVQSQLGRGARPPASGVEKFLNEVERDAEHGWATSSEEIDEGVWSAAASIHRGEQFLGTLSVPCPVFRVDNAATEKIISAVRHTADQISRRLTP